MPGRSSRAAGVLATGAQAPAGAGAAPGTGTAHAPGSRPGRKVGAMTVAGRKVLLLAASEFEDMELLYPLYRVREEEVTVTVAGLDDRPVTGKKGHGPVAVDTTVDGLSANDFDALVIPGGYAPDKLRRSAAVLDLVRAFDDAGKPIAFICHAGWVLISARTPADLGAWMKALLHALA